MSNLKQIGLGILQYTQDHDGGYPVGYFDAETTAAGAWWSFTSNPPQQCWGQTIQPYLKSEDLFFCPSGPNHKGTLFQGTPATMNYGIVSFFVRNEYLPNFSPMRDSAVLNPASKYMVMDAGFIVLHPAQVNSPVWITNNGGYLPGAGDAGVACWSDVPDCQKGRHFTGSNVTFADGHVKWIGAKKLHADSLTHTVSGPWQPMVE